MPNPMISWFNLLRVNGDDVYKDAVPPLADKSPIGDVMNPILSDMVIFKKFTALMGAWMKDEVFAEAWNHPVIQDIVKNGNGMPTGNYTRQIANNPVNPQKYNPAHPEKVLEQRFTKDFINFYIRNAYDKFKVSFPFDEIQEAFTSYEGAQSYVSMKKASLISGANFTTFNHLKEALYANRMNGGLTVKTLPANVENLTSEQWLDVGQEIEAFTKKATFISPDYIAYNQLTEKVDTFYGWARKEDIRVIGTVDFFTGYGYKALANMFNMQIGDIKNICHEIDTFDYPIYNYESGQIVGFQKSDVVAMIVDIRGLKATTDMEQDLSVFNEDTLVNTIIKHKWGTFAMSPFNKCLCFVNPTNSATAFTVSQAEKNTIVRYGTSAILDFSKSTTTQDSFSHSLNFFNGNDEGIYYSGSTDITHEINEAIKKEVNNGDVINDVYVAIAIILYYTAANGLKAEYTDIDGIVKSVNLNASMTHSPTDISIGSFGKEIPIRITRRDNTDYVHIDSYTVNDLTVTISPETLQAIDEMDTIWVNNSDVTVKCNGNAATGSPVTIKYSPYSNYKW